MFIRCVLNSFFSTGKIHIECQTWTEQRPKSPPVVSLISGQTSTLCIWLWQSSPAVWKYPRCSINSLDALFNFGSFFKLLCGWLESVQCCLLRIHLMLFLFVEAWYNLWPLQDSSVAAFCSTCTKWILLKLLGHLFIPPDILQDVEVLARRWGSRVWFTNVPTVTQKERKERSSAKLI